MFIRISKSNVFKISCDQQICIVVRKTKWRLSRTPYVEGHSRSLVKSETHVNLFLRIKVLSFGLIIFGHCNECTHIQALKTVISF